MQFTAFFQYLHFSVGKKLSFTAMTNRKRRKNKEKDPLFSTTDEVRGRAEETPALTGY